MDYKVYSVSELNGQVKNLIENTFSLPVFVEGEITDYKASSSGHIYFTISDEKSRLNCAMWRFKAMHMPRTMEKGTFVIVSGKMNVYAEGGTYSLIADKLDIAGEGMKKLKLAQLKKKLKDEGLFSEERKKPLPFLPRTVGVVTAETGAAFRDIIKVIKRRNSFVDIILAPCAVQGREAPEAIAYAIKAQNDLGTADVLIVGRGGGGSEDLSAFDDERVVRAVADSAIPVVSAVGHEIDYSLTDLAADIRAETPSSAAEKVMQNLSLLEDGLFSSRQRLDGAVLFNLGRFSEYSESVKKRLFRREPRKLLQDIMSELLDIMGRMFKITDIIGEQNAERFISQRHRLAEAARNTVSSLREKADAVNKGLIYLAPDVTADKKTVGVLRGRLSGAAKIIIEKKRDALAVSISGLRGGSPLAIMDKGYAVVFKKNEPVWKIEGLKTGENIRVLLSDGEVLSEVKRVLKTGEGGIIEHLRRKDEKT